MPRNVPAAEMTERPDPVYRFGRFELLTQRRQLLQDGVPVPLGQRAFDLLVVLVERAGDLVTKDELLERAWPGLIVEENNLQVQISGLRKVLGTGAIVTVASRGYSFTLALEAHGVRSAVPDDHVIAVLPLEDLSGRPDEGYFTDGMAEALITDLTKLGGVKVISRGSVIGFKGTREPRAKIGEALGANLIVEGSVLRSGHRVRISARLVRAATDEHLWAERYDRELADVLALQDEVARSIVHAIDKTLRPRPVVPPRRVDPEVYLLDMRGRHFWHQRTEAGFRAALRAFEEAVLRDPTYAPAHVGIAESLNMLSNYGLVPPQQIRPASLAAARRALELDDASADAHRVLAFCEWQFAFAWERAMAEYERALELSPDSSSTTYWFGLFLAVVGDFARAHEFLRRSYVLDPLSRLVPSVQGWAHVFERQYEVALPFFQHVLSIDPDYHLALWFQGEALVELGHFDEGIRSLTRAYELGGRTPRLLGYLGYSHGRAGRADRARACLAELEDRARRGAYVPPYFPALVFSGLGEHDEALAFLEQAYATGDTMLRDLKADPHWDRMRALPRFKALATKMAFPVWNTASLT